jgi:hypothetical protein
MGIRKIILDKYPSYSRKLKILKVIFVMNFVCVPLNNLPSSAHPLLPDLEQKPLVLDFYLI